MLITDVEFAEYLGSSYFSGVSLATRKRRLRKMAALFGLNPVIKCKKEWVFRKSDLSKLVEAWDLNLSNGRDRHTGIFAGPSEASQSMKARDYLTSVNPVRRRLPQTIA